MNKADGNTDKSAKEIQNCLDYYEIRIKRSLRDPKFVLEVAGFIVLFVYAIYTIRMYYATQEAATAATKAANTASDQLEAQTRPWLGLAGEPSINDLRMSGPYVTGIKLKLRNYGQSPAVGLVKTPQFTVLQTPKSEVNYFDILKTCQIADDESLEHNTNAYSEKRHGYVDGVFPGPGAEIEQEAAISQTEIPGLAFPAPQGAPWSFIFGCLAYQGQNGTRYHTRLIYQVLFSRIITHPDGTQYRDATSIVRIFYDPK